MEARALEGIAAGLLDVEGRRIDICCARRRSLCLLRWGAIGVEMDSARFLVWGLS